MWRWVSMRMPRLPTITSKKLIVILETLGFVKDHATGSHFVYYDKKRGRRAVVPVHSKDLPKGTLMSILKQAGITKEEIK